MKIYNNHQAIYVHKAKEWSMEEDIKWLWTNKDNNTTHKTLETLVETKRKKKKSKEGKQDNDLRH